MTVTVASCTLSELFSGDAIPDSEGGMIEGCLTIPEYQRSYQWRDTQINRLLNDFYHHRKEQQDRKAGTASPFYLGSIILHQQSYKKSEKPRLNIIDGQQRLTTLAIIAFLQKRFTHLSLSYESPESQQQIKRNLMWLEQHKQPELQTIDLDQVSFTLVVTRSEDDAYRFFETQNTGGVRLGGADIIKAHHLRAVDEIDKQATDQFAKRWEALGDLEPVIKALLRGRYWQSLFFRELPLHNQKPQIRTSIVSELAEKTGKGEDIAYGRIWRTRLPGGREMLSQAQTGYELRQPLNAGANTIHYLQYFQGLEQMYLKENPNLNLPKYTDFYKFICGLEGCSYLKQLFDTCLLLYISQFGTQQLDLAAKKLFRVTYSRRVENQKAVKEKSVPAFVKETPVLDWITMSYTAEQCFARLDNFELKVDGSNLDKNGVKKRFINKVCEYFNLTIEPVELAEKFGKCFTEAVGQKLGNEVIK